MEMVTAARRMLLADAGVRGYAGEKVFKYKLGEGGHPQGTGGRSIVVRPGGSWSAPDLVQSSEYPRLYIDFWADVDRDEALMPREANSEDKAFAMWRLVNPLIHRQRDVWWGAGGSSAGLRIITANLSADPFYETQATAHEGVSLGDCAVVTAVYNLHIAP